jgi:hypothetical protein
VRLADQPQDGVNHEQIAASRLENPETGDSVKKMQDFAPASSN